MPVLLAFLVYELWTGSALAIARFGLGFLTSSTWDPDTRCGPSLQSRDTAAPPGCGSSRMHLALVCTAMPSASRMPRMDSETSGSSRAIRCGAISITVTRAPKRRWICANSRPM